MVGMHRYAIRLVLTAALAAAAPALAQQPTQPPPQAAQPAPQPAQPGTQVLVEQADARETRERLRELLRQHPPAVGEILQRDPSLARPDYLAPYPALVAFLQQHPEIARNPSFFFGEYQFQENQQPQNPSYRMVEEVFEYVSIMVVVGIIAGAVIWLIRAIIDQRRWLRVARTQAEVHTKLLDRMANNEDLLAYIQTPAGRRFLESGPVMTDGEPAKPFNAPLARIMWSQQAGVVMACLGMGFWVSQTTLPPESDEGFFIIGTLATALGIGFVLSAVLAYMISSRFGLVVPHPQPSVTHE